MLYSILEIPQILHWRNIDHYPSPQSWVVKNVQMQTDAIQLVEEGTVEPVHFSEWASPIVAVLKSDKKKVRIYGDFKQTVNPVSKLDWYPLPRVQDLFATLAGGKSFTKLDLSRAYQLLPLDDSYYEVINTHKGLFQFQQLPYGISSAPGIFQQVMENILRGIPGVTVYVDDILITGPTTEAHLKTLDKMLSL